MRKKFKTRIKHFGETKYTVDYCYYRFIPIWHSLAYWYDLGHPGNTYNHGWDISLWNYKSAEEIAKNIKNIKDVEEYHKPHVEKSLKWKDDEKEFWINNKPYRIKIINSD